MNRDYLLEQLRLIQEYLDRARSLSQERREDFVSDWMKTDAAVRELTVLFETSHNIAKPLISSFEWPNAESKAEAFEILAEERVLPQTLADRFRQAARFRNLVTYQTTMVDNNVVYDVLTERLGDFEQFAAHVAHWLEQRHDEASQ